jgi:hypothetical protein
MEPTLLDPLLTGALVATTNTWHVEQGEVRVICPMTIGGSFDAKTSALSGSLAASVSGSRVLDGSLVVDLRTLDTGIGLRNEHLRENYLEVGSGPGSDTATLSEVELNGLDPDVPEGKGSFTGLLSLHGVTRAVSGTVEVRQTSAGPRVKASFPVHLPDYRIPAPRYLGIGVKNTVQVEVGFAISRRAQP